MTTTLKDRHGNELCRGFLATRIDRAAGQIFETLFAVLNDGTVLMSDERQVPCYDFDRPGSVWVAIDAMPAGLEFIGNYPVPKVRHAFNGTRIEPLTVLTTTVGFPLVFHGGRNDLSEAYFDAANASAMRAGLIFCGYDIALMGGEPYAVWK